MQNDYKYPTTPQTRRYTRPRPVIRCDASLIIMHVSGCCCFSDINISRGDVATRLRCGRIFIIVLHES